LLSKSTLPHLVCIKHFAVFHPDGDPYMIRITTSLLALVALTACNTPNPPTVTSADIDRAYAEARAISNLPFTATDNLPLGRVTYQGQIGADIRGDENGSILGDMRMDVDFNDGDVGGRVSNINLIDTDGRPNQRFGGTLEIDGGHDSGRIGATAFGDIDGVDDAGFIVESNLNLRLNGNVFDDFGRGDAVFGSVSGDAKGDIDFDVDGVFFATAN
jgi:hypothetical protein